MSIHNKFLDLLAELNPLHRLDPYKQPANQHTMNSDTPKPKMEGDRAKEVTKQTTTRTDNTTRQPSAIKTTNPVQHLVDITDALKIAKSKPTSTLSPADAAEWEEVFKPELSEEDNGSDDWEMIDECDAKPCVVPAKKLLAKRQKKVGSLAKLGWWHSEYPCKILLTYTHRP